MIGREGDLRKVCHEETSSSMAKAETTNLPVTTKATATNPAFRMVRLILLMIHVSIR